LATAEVEHDIGGIVAGERVGVVVVNSVETRAGGCACGAVTFRTRGSVGGGEEQIVGLEWTVGSSTVHVGSIIPDRGGSIISSDGIFELGDWVGGRGLGDLQGDTAR